MYHWMTKGFHNWPPPYVAAAVVADTDRTSVRGGDVVFGCGWDGGWSAGDVAACSAAGAGNDAVRTGDGPAAAADPRAPTAGDVAGTADGWERTDAADGVGTDVDADQTDAAACVDWEADVAEMTGDAWHVAAGDWVSGEVGMIAAAWHVVVAENPASGEAGRTGAAWHVAAAAGDSASGGGVGGKRDCAADVVETVETGCRVAVGTSLLTYVTGTGVGDWPVAAAGAAGWYDVVGNPAQ